MKTGGSASFLLLTAVLALWGLHTAWGQSVRPGVCPPERKHVPDPFQDPICSKDGDCLLNHKCCTDNKDKFCKPPAKAKPGKCPVVPYNEAGIKNREDFCTDDSECPGTTSKCCLTETGKKCPPSGRDKPGVCPPPGPICIRGTRQTCENDSGCAGNLKCCQYKCGLSCRPPQ